MERLVEVPADLMVLHPLPPVPSHGENEALLNWAVACATTARMYTEQTKTLQDVTHRQITEDPP